MVLYNVGRRSHVLTTCNAQRIPELKVFVRRSKTLPHQFQTCSHHFSLYPKVLSTCTIREVLYSMEAITQSLFPIFLLLSSLSDISASILVFPEALSQHLLGILLSGAQSPKPLSFKFDLSLDLALSHIRHTCLLLGNVEAKLAWPRHPWFLGTVLFPWPWASVEVKTINLPRAPQELADLFLKASCISFPLSLLKGQREEGREGEMEV